MNYDHLRYFKVFSLTMTTNFKVGVSMLSKHELSSGETRTSCDSVIILNDVATFFSFFFFFFVEVRDYADQVGLY